MSAPIGAKARRLFLEGLAETCNVTAAAGRTRHDRRSFYRLRETDVSFRESWDAAIEEAIDRLEAQAYKFAMEGAEERTYDSEGKLVSRRVREDPGTVARLLAAHRPSLYSERHRLSVDGAIDVEHTLTNGPVVTLRDLMQQQRELEAGEVVAVEDEPVGGGS